mmetsp:Transcript_13624/g.30216  ORF Transcript_13624/g.30216 Transcript_13624/m.30216 type:complete len:151 (+) Transcript_13624:67-519(+)
MDPEVIAQARAKLMKKQAGSSDVLGGMRRKQKRVHKAPTSTDDKKLLAALKKVGCNPIPGIEEVNMFKSDGRVIHFASPKLQASLGANTYAVMGVGEDKALQELLPGIISQLGADTMQSLKQLAASMAAQSADDDVPDLGSENFEDVSKD